MRKAEKEAYEKWRNSDSGKRCNNLTESFEYTAFRNFEAGLAAGKKIQKQRMEQKK